MQARYAIWHTVKALDQQYMEAQLARAGPPSPQVRQARDPQVAAAQAL